MTLEHRGDVRTDPYFWLRERESPEVIAHLEAECESVERDRKGRWGRGGSPTRQVPADVLIGG